MSRHVVSVVTLALLAGLSGCSRSDEPQTGSYRAAIKLSGGEIPVELRIDKKSSGWQLLVKRGHSSLPATELRIGNHALHALLPQDLGTLDLQFDGNSMRGTLRRLSVEGGQITFPVTAKPHEHYCFVEKSLTDNADVSGNWSLQMSSSTAPESMALAQTHDAVNGAMQTGAASCTVRGQVRDNDVYLAAFCKDQLWLLKGMVDQQGNLQGQAWRDNDPPLQWHAMHDDHAVQQDTDNRIIGLP